MPIKLNGATNGSVELDVPAAVGSDLQVTLPATAGTAIVKATDGSVDLGSVDIDSSGNVKIASEHLRFNTSGKGIIFGTDGGSNRPSIIGNYTSSSDNNIVFNVTGSERLRIATSGVIDFTGPGYTAGSNSCFIKQDSSGEGYLFNRGNNDLLFGTNNTERARLDTSGRLLLGTTSGSGDPRLIVQGKASNATDEGGIFIRRGSQLPGAGHGIGDIFFGNNSGHVGAQINVQSDGSWGTNDYPARIGFRTTADGQSSPVERMRISQNGHVKCPGFYAPTTSSGANMHVESDGDVKRSTSSKKYKTAIEDVENTYSDALLNCRPVWYRSTCTGDNPEHGFWGFIAEEVAEIDPRLVFWKTNEVTYDENGSAVATPCEPEAEGVQYDRFVPHLLNLIKRQQAAIETLETKVAALEAAP